MTDWHLLCITNRGKVSILKNLDLETARQAYKKLMPDTKPRTYINQEYAESCCTFNDYNGREPEELEKVEVLGPEGQELDPWFGVEPEIIDYKKTPYA